MAISRSVNPRMKNVSDKSCRENQNTHFVFSNFFLVENRAANEVTCKNRVERGRAQLTIWRLRIACQITSATNTCAGFVLLLLHCNNGCTNEPRYYLISILPVLFYYVAGRCIVGVTERMPVYILLLLLLLLLLTYLHTAIELSLGGSSPYTSTDKTIKNKYKYSKQ